MGDIICRNCGEPWDSYGARHGDMTHAEYQMLISGKGCPACQGKPVFDCTRFGTEYVPYDMLKTACPKGEYLQWGQTCSYEGECEYKKPRKRVDDVEFLSALDNNTDGMEALDAAMNIEFEEKKKHA